jgi:hypothetical protein
MFEANELPVRGLKVVNIFEEDIAFDFKVLPPHCLGLELIK